MNPHSNDPARFLSRRWRDQDGRGARLLFELQANLPDAADLSLGQPTFQVPTSLKDAAILAIEDDHNRYTHPQGARDLVERLRSRVEGELPLWKGRAPGSEEGFEATVTAGVTGGLVAAALACLDPGDEIVIQDPYFMAYPHLATLTGATPVYVDTYPDFRLTRERLESVITPRTKLVLLNSPSNPAGTVASESECEALARLADERGFLILADEVYRSFCYGDSASEVPAVAPSVGSYTVNAILLRGFSKSHALMGWRLGYAVGPAPLLDKMTDLSLLLYLCAPSIAQQAGLAALADESFDPASFYRRNRERVVERLDGLYEFEPPEGAFYAFVRVPDAFGMTGTEFVMKCVSEHRLLLVPGGAFSSRDTHFRLSFVSDEATLERGLASLVELARSAGVSGRS